MALHGLTPAFPCVYPGTGTSDVVGVGGGMEPPDVADGLGVGVGVGATTVTLMARTLRLFDSDIEYAVMRTANRWFVPRVLRVSLGVRHLLLSLELVHVVDSTTWPSTSTSRASMPILTVGFGVLTSSLRVVVEPSGRRCVEGSDVIETVLLPSRDVSRPYGTSDDSRATSRAYDETAHDDVSLANVGLATQSVVSDAAVAARPASVLVATIVTIAR